MLTLFISIGIILIIMPIIIYNKLKREHLKIKEAHSNVSVYLQNRYEEISKAYKIAEEFRAHEESIFKEIVSLREQIKMNNSGDIELSDVHNKIADRIPQLFARLEAYPELKSQTNFLEVQKQIENNEANISAARRSFNAYVNRYNTSIALFPLNIFAGIFNFKEEKLFEVSDNNYLSNPLY